MATNPIPRKWTFEEYLQHEEETDMRYEYIDGEIYAMSGGTRKHTRIKINTTLALSRLLEGKSCELYDSDMKVKISDLKYLYPDVSVVCGESVFADNNESMLTNPTLVIEVMSPSSENYDKGKKYDFYRTLPSMKAYLLLDQSRAYAALYTPQEDGWRVKEFKERDAIIPLDMIDCVLSLSDVYANIEFDSA